MNLSRVDQLHAEIVSEYQPTTLELRDACRLLANVKERLESTKADTTEHQRLLTQWSDLSTQLRTARVTDTSINTADLDPLNDDQLIERAARVLKMLLLLRDSRIDDPVNPAGLAVMADAPTLSEGEAPTPVPAPEPNPYVPFCAYCRRHPCVGVDHAAYSVLHWTDPSEIDKRRQKASDEMLGQLGKPLPDWYRE